MNASRTAVGAGYAAVCLAIGVVGMTLPRAASHPEPDWELHGWKPDPAQLAAAKAADQALVDEYPLEDDVGPQMTALFALGRAEVSAKGDIGDPTYLEATKTANAAMIKLWFSRGKEAYLALGVYAGRAFAEAVSDVLQRAREDRMPVLAWLRAYAGTPPAQRLRNFGGNFVENAVSWGLITPDNQLAGGTDDLIRIHFKVRWCRFVTDITDYTFLMHPEELRALWRWRLEGDLTLPMEQRRRVGTWLRRIEPDYPIYETLGAVYARRGRYRKALALYREALLDAPFDRKLRRNVQFLMLAIDEIPELTL